MKHIKKKYLFQKNIILPNNVPHIDLDKDLIDQKILKENFRKSHIFVQTTDNDLYLAFIHNNSGTYVPIALPDFTLVYFDFAYRLNKQREDIKKDLLKKLATVDAITEDRSKELYEFFGISTSCIINLFTSIESFINHLLPSDKNYIAKRNNRTEIYDRDQIQLYISFMDKLKLVLPQFFGKNFYSKSTKANSHLQNLKELRDNLIHTKSDDTFDKHIEIFRTLLNFKFTETFEAITQLFNFYQPGYLEPCPCNQDF